MPYDRFGRFAVRKVRAPTENMHSVNLGFLKTELGSYITSDKLRVILENELKKYFLISPTQIDFRGRVLHNVGNPRYSNDGVHYHNILTTCMIIKDGQYNASNKRIANLADPIHPQDAVSLKVMEQRIAAALSSKKSG